MNRSYRIGYRFQQRVKKHLESEGWNCVVHPRSKFPDIIAWRSLLLFSPYFEVQMVECKVNKYLSKDEKIKARVEIIAKNCTRFLVAYRKKRKLMFYEVDRNGERRD